MAHFEDFSPVFRPDKQDFPRRRESNFEASLSETALARKAKECLLI